MCYIVTLTTLLSMNREIEGHTAELSFRKKTNTKIIKHLHDTFITNMQLKQEFIASKEL